MSKETQVLEKAITEHASVNEISKVIITAFGEKYIFEGAIQTPSGKSLNIRSIWVKEMKEEIIKFVTLYPI